MADDLDQLRLENEALKAQIRANDEVYRAAMKDVERSNAELEQFAYVASHDLKEPLRMISQYASLLADECGDQVATDGKLYLQYITKGADSMRELIDGLLNFSRVGRHTTFEHFSVDQAIDDAIATLNGAVAEANATITRGPMPEICADLKMMSRVFLNLITNAIKYSREEESPRVHITCAEREDVYEFCVRDNGMGFDPRNAEKVFVIFQRLHPGSRSGTGIGLAVCKKIVERHGGRIWVTSKPGVGSAFYFNIRKNPSIFWDGSE